MCVCHGTHVEVREQPVGFGSLLPCGMEGLNSGLQAWQRLYLLSQLTAPRLHCCSVGRELEHGLMLPLPV